MAGVSSNFSPPPPPPPHTTPPWALATALRMLSWPSETTPVIGTGRAPAHLVDQARQVRGRGRHEALGQEDLAGEAVAEDPEDFEADIRLQAVDGQDDAALRAEQRLQPPGIGRGQGPQLIVAVQEVGDGALGEDDPPAAEFAVDLGDTAVLGIAEPADQGHDVESELVIGQGEVGLGLGAVGPEEAGTLGIGQRRMVRVSRKTLSRVLIVR